jgi:8-oxo-dGTP pyrophosphatase MutT (NUDIX family)
MPPERYASIVDVHVILRRGGRILLLRRAGDTYASGQLCLTGHMEEGESILTAAVRETLEETAITLDPAVLRHVLSIHQRNPEPVTPGSDSPSRPVRGTASRSTPSRTSTPSSSGPTPPPCRPTPSATPPP